MMPQLVLDICTVHFFCGAGNFFRVQAGGKNYSVQSHKSHCGLILLRTCRTEQKKLLSYQICGHGVLIPLPVGERTNSFRIISEPIQPIKAQSKETNNTNEKNSGIGFVNRPAISPFQVTGRFIIIPIVKFLHVYLFLNSLARISRRRTMALGLQPPP